MCWRAQSPAKSGNAWVCSVVPRLALFASDHAVCCTNDIMQTTAETSFEAARPVMTQRTSYISSNMPYDGEVRKRACALHVGVVASPEVPPGAQRLLWPTLIG